MALFFAANRWGNGEGIFDYAAMARRILHACVHKGEQPGTGDPMWDPENHLIKFIPNCNFSDPSYHLPHFYELFALWADEADRPFWRKAAEASRAYLLKACHPRTGLCAEYANYDGTPWRADPARGRHDWFYSDAYRTVANIGLDACWFGDRAVESPIADRLLRFFSEECGGDTTGVYEIDGTKVDEDALHPHRPAGHQRPGRAGRTGPGRRRLGAPPVGDPAAHPARAATTTTACTCSHCWRWAGSTASGCRRRAPNVCFPAFARPRVRPG